MKNSQIKFVRAWTNFVSNMWVGKVTKKFLRSSSMYFGKKCGKKFLVNYEKSGYIFDMVLLAFCSINPNEQSCQI